MKILLFTLSFLVFSAHAENKRIALVKDGVVVNVAVWDGIAPWDPPGVDKVEVSEKNNVEIGDTYNGKSFVKQEAKPIEMAPDQKKMNDLESRLKALEDKK